jgi:hypothetical protein
MTDTGFCNTYNKSVYKNKSQGGHNEKIRRQHQHQSNACTQNTHGTAIAVPASTNMASSAGTQQALNKVGNNQRRRVSHPSFLV